jgi:hypothetical protein
VRSLSSIRNKHNLQSICSTARGVKVAQLRQRLEALGYGDKAEVVDVPDIAHGVFSLHGVSAVIHTASPLAFSDCTPNEILNASFLKRYRPMLITA